MSFDRVKYERDFSILITRSSINYGSFDSVRNFSKIRWKTFAMVKRYTVEHISIILRCRIIERKKNYVLEGKKKHLSSSGNNIKFSVNKIRYCN